MNAQGVMLSKKSAPEAWGTEALKQSRRLRREHQDKLAANRDRWIESNRYYYDRLKRMLRYIVEPGKRVLEIRCQTGHLLGSVDAAYGVGVDISDELIGIAQRNHPHLRFVRSEPEELELGETFDYIILSHIFDTVDIQKTFESVRRHSTTDTRLIVINYNPLWQPILELASKTGLRAPFVEPNWIDEYDLRTFLELAGFRALRTHRLLLMPKNLWPVSTVCNDLVGRLPGFRKLCMMQVLVARPQPEPRRAEATSVSVVVPCRNEGGNIQPAVERIPEMGRGTEIIFCDDKSTDNTAAEVRRMQALYPERRILLLDGPGICKAENVWTGFRAATGDVLMILDADLTVMPEELPVFFNALVENRGEFINGNRLVYPIPKAAMKFANRVGNKVFGMVFSFLLDQRIKDTLCGTKVIWRRDWPRIEKNAGKWGIRDLWGDYDLLFGASKLHLEILDVPVHYQERVYGVTKMTKVFWNGVRMARICWGAWRRLRG
ncbi:MAG TPA: glycosyltransferase [Bryobacteraceae bacterium]|jgi:SAM-dependent methyltransferase|nr:glycosyltransferase [Bryobacteraceae bacterium]